MPPCGVQSSHNFGQNSRSTFCNALTSRFTVLLVYPHEIFLSEVDTCCLQVRHCNEIFSVQWVPLWATWECNSSWLLELTWKPAIAHHWAGCRRLWSLQGLRKLRNPKTVREKILASGKSLSSDLCFALNSSDGPWWDHLPGANRKGSTLSHDGIMRMGGV